MHDEHPLDGGDPELTDYITAGGMNIARVRLGQGRYYEHSDHLGSPVAQTRTNGALATRTRYTPFGLEMDTVGLLKDQDGFPGHIKDSATGLNYDPVMGRFLSVDPVTFLDTGQPGMFNRYTYSLNDPINRIDPDGRQSCSHCDEWETTLHSKVSTTNGKVTERGGGIAPEGGTTYSDGRYDATGESRFRIGSDGNGRAHEGVDLAGTEGDEVVAPMDGTVTRADSVSRSYGGQVEISQID